MAVIRFSERLECGLGRVAVKVDLEFVDDFRWQFGEVSAVFGGDHHAFRASIHRDTQLVAETFYAVVIPFLQSCRFN